MALLGAGCSRAVRCDVTNSDDVGALAEMADRELGGADLVVNNAGVAVAGRVGEIALADWEWIVAGELLRRRARLPPLRPTPAQARRRRNPERRLRGRPPRRSSPRTRRRRPRWWRSPSRSTRSSAGTGVSVTVLLPDLLPDQHPRQRARRHARSARPRRALDGPRQEPGGRRRATRSTPRARRSSTRSRTPTGGGDGG